MYYTEAEFEAEYPQAQYPLVHQRYQIILNYMKTQYGLDLLAIGEGPMAQ